MLEDELLPNTRVEMNFEIDSDYNLIWQAGANCRVVITRMLLYVPRITFNSKGQSSYMSQYLKTHKWTYLRENIERSNSSQQRSGHFIISTGISKPGHVFVFIINDANIDAQTANPFLYNSFSVSTEPRTLSNCHLRVGNGSEYPEIHYNPATDMTRIYRDVLKYVHKGNEYGEGSLLNRANFSTMTVYFPVDTTNGHGMINPYPYMSPPFFGTWENPVGMGVKKKKRKGIAGRRKQSIQFNPNARSNTIKFVNKPLSIIDLLHWVKQL